MAGVLRVAPLASALSTANCFSSCYTGETFQIMTTGSTGRQIYAGLHWLGSTADGVAWTWSVQSATACAFAAPTTRFTFTAQSCNGAQFLTPITSLPALSTEILYWRAMGNPATTGDYKLGCIWMSVQ